MGSALVQQTLGGQTFAIVDPKSYPHGWNAYDEEEPIFADWMRHARPGCVLVDVGMGWGNYTMPALAAGATVHAFEPSQEQVETVQLAIGANGFGPRCTVHMHALFDGGSYPPELAAWVHGQAYPAKDVEYFRLDECVTSRVDAIKIDVEGGELGVLRGAEKTLRRCKPIVLVEDHAGINPGHVISEYPESLGGTAALIKFLEGLGYDCEPRSWVCGRKYLVARPWGGA